MSGILQDKRILIVEDNVVNIAVISTILRSQGAVVVQDFWQSSTIDMLEQHFPLDLILMDLHLSKGISGYDIFIDMQGHAKLKDIPVIIVSASDPSTEIPKAKALGLSGYIAKPIVMNEFPTQIKQVMDGKKVWFAGE